MKRKLSIHDIAKELNVSSTTVSFVINGKAAEKRISSDMEKKILHYINKVGYQPNMMAKSLRTGKSKIIGLMVENMYDPFFSSIARIIEENTYQLGYKIFHSSTDNDTLKSKDLIKAFRERQVDGYIIAPAPGIENDIQQLIDDGIPVIQFDRYLSKLKTDVIVIDNMDGAFIGVQHLVENGYKMIAFVTLDSLQVQMMDRLAGYKKALQKFGLKKYVLNIPYGTESDVSTEMIKDFISNNPGLDALFFATNYLAISGLKAIKDLQMNVPGQMGVVGFDDNTHFALFSPSITAIAQPIKEISDEVVRSLINCLAERDNKNRKPEKVELKVTLNIRESSQRNSLNH
ncbi:MAG: substrate-binding domain-containing protein [Ferruginibacter sp.]